MLIFCAVYFIYAIDDKPSYLIIARIHTIIEFSILALLFSSQYKNNAFKIFSKFAIFPFLFFCIYDFISAKTPSIAYKPLLVECVFFIILIIYFLFEKMKEPFNDSLFQTFFFWIAVALLINFSGNFLLFFYSETSNDDPDFKTNYAIIYCTVTIVKNLIFCFAVSIKERINFSSSPTNTIMNISLKESSTLFKND